MNTRPWLWARKTSRSNSFAVSVTSRSPSRTSCRDRSISSEPTRITAIASPASVAAGRAERLRIAFTRATSSRGENGFAM